MPPDVVKYKGGCHCGNIGLEFHTAIAPGDLEIRECQCSFCRKHAARAASDPSGQLIISVENSDKLNRYKFALGTAEFLICRECGVYVGSVTIETDDQRGIVIVNALEDREKFDRGPQAVSYDGEDEEYRISRRASKWMPVSLRLP